MGTGGPGSFLSWGCSRSTAWGGETSSGSQLGGVDCRGPGVLPPHLSPSRAVVKPEMLQKATVELLDQALCTSLYGHSLTDRMVCAGYLDGKVDSCQVSPAPGKGARGPRGRPTSP